MALVSQNELHSDLESKKNLDSMPLVFRDGVALSPAALAECRCLPGWREPASMPAASLTDS